MGVPSINGMTSFHDKIHIAERISFHIECTNRGKCALFVFGILVKTTLHICETSKQKMIHNHKKCMLNNFIPRVLAGKRRALAK